MTDQPAGYLGPFGIRQDPPPPCVRWHVPTFPEFDARPFVDAINQAAGRMAERHRAAIVAAQLKRGDKVRLSSTFYVGKVNADGTVQLATTRDAFPEPVTLDRCHTSRLALVEAGPAEPKVGDTISADDVRATPWRRGTLIRYVGEYGTDGGRYALTSDGMWRDVEHGAAIPFGHLRGRFVIEHAPGK